MRVVRRPAYQAHAVPSTAMSPRGPFPPEVMASNPIVYGDEVDPDNDLPHGATAQNNYRGIQLLRCTSCGAVVPSDEADFHECGGDDGEG